MNESLELRKSPHIDKERRLGRESSRSKSKSGMRKRAALGEPHIFQNCQGGGYGERWKREKQEEDGHSMEDLVCH